MAGVTLRLQHPINMVAKMVKPNQKGSPRADLAGTVAAFTPVLFYTAMPVPSVTITFLAGHALSIVVSGDFPST